MTAFGLVRTWALKPRRASAARAAGAGDHVGGHALAGEGGHHAEHVAQASWLMTVQVPVLSVTEISAWP